MDALILIVQQEGREPREVRLAPGLTVGRSRQNGCVVEDSELGRHQFKVVGAGAALLLEELGSSNPTRVDGRLLRKGDICPLQPGSTLAAGRTTFHIVHADGEVSEIDDDDTTAIDVADVVAGDVADDVADDVVDNVADNGNTEEAPRPGARPSPASPARDAARPVGARHSVERPVPSPATASHSSGDDDGGTIADARPHAGATSAGKPPAVAASPGVPHDAALPSDEPAAVTDAENTVSAPRPARASTPSAEPPPPPAHGGTAGVVSEQTVEARRPGGGRVAEGAGAAAKAQPQQQEDQEQQQQQQPAPRRDGEPEAPRRLDAASDDDEGMDTVERSRDELKVISRMSPRRPLLIVKRGTLRRRFQVQDARAVIGRGEGCAIRLLEGSVSDQHAELSFDGSGFLLRDLDSANGTRLRERELQNVREDVRCHDLVGFGVVEGVFLTADGTAAAAARKLQKNAARRLVRDQRLSREEYREALRQVSEDGRRHLAEIVLLETAVEPAEWASSIAAARRARTRGRWLWALVLLLLVAAAAAAVAWRTGWLEWEW